MGGSFAKSRLFGCDIFALAVALALFTLACSSKEGLWDPIKRPDCWHDDKTTMVLEAKGCPADATFYSRMREAVDRPRDKGWKKEGTGRQVTAELYACGRYEFKAVCPGWEDKIISLTEPGGWLVFRFLMAEGPSAPPEDRRKIPAEPLPAVQQRWAVVVGVAEYESPNITGLKYADADARSFRDFLVSPAGLSFPRDHVRLLTNDQATLKNLRHALYEFLKEAVREDLVVIFFSGHGAVDPNRAEILYLLTHDADPDSLASTALPMHHVRDALDTTVKAERVVVLADACHSGGVARDMKDVGLASRNQATNTQFAGLSVFPPELSQAGRGRVIFTSSTAGETSQEGTQYTLPKDPEEGHGVFTWALLKALWGEADLDADKRVTLSEAIEYTDLRVRRVTKSAQNPAVSGNPDELDLTIGRVLE